MLTLTFTLLILRLLKPAHQTWFRTPPSNRKSEGKHVWSPRPFFLDLALNSSPDIHAVIKLHFNTWKSLLASALLSCIWQPISKSQLFSGKDGSKGWTLHSDFHAKHTALPWELRLWFSLEHPCEHPAESHESRLTYSCSPFFWPCSSHCSCLTHRAGQHAFLQRPQWQ